MDKWDKFSDAELLKIAIDMHAVGRIVGAAMPREALLESIKIKIENDAIKVAKCEATSKDLQLALWLIRKIGDPDRTLKAIKCAIKMHKILEPVE